jgi:hypothetical protein
VPASRGDDSTAIYPARLHSVALFVPAGVEDRRAAAGPAAVAAVLLLVFFHRDDGLDRMPPQPGAVRPGGVRLICHRAVGGCGGGPFPRRRIRIASIKGAQYGESPCWPGLVGWATGRLTELYASGARRVR